MPIVRKIQATKDQFFISCSHCSSKLPLSKYAVIKLKEITNPTYPRYNMGGCMAKAGSCKTGFISAPSTAPNGKILSKGLDVKSKNNRLNINKVNFFKG